MTAACSTCRYFRLGRQSTSQGKCYRNPPSDIGARPAVCDTDFCGEYVKQSPAQTAPSEDPHRQCWLNVLHAVEKIRYHSRDAIMNSAWDGINFQLGVIETNAKEHTG